jgi:hypothetical protein
MAFAHMRDRSARAGFAQFTTLSGRLRTRAYIPEYPQIRTQLAQKLAHPTDLDSAGSWSRAAVAQLHD